MNYYGSLIQPEAEMWEQVLRPALMKVGSEKDVLPLRGPTKFTVGEYCYIFECTGSLEHFVGMEKITKNGELIYQLHCSGGIIK